MKRLTRVAENVGNGLFDSGDAGRVVDVVASGSVEDLALGVMGRGGRKVIVMVQERREGVISTVRRRPSCQVLTLYTCSCAPGWPHLNQRQPRGQLQDSLEAVLEVSE